MKEPRQYKAVVWFADKDRHLPPCMTFFSGDKDFKQIFASLKGSAPKVVEVKIYKDVGQTLLYEWELIKTMHSLEE